MVEMWINPDNTDQVAIKTGDAVTAGDYFIYDIDNGGYYSNGKAEKVNQWIAVDTDTIEPPGKG